MRLDILDNGHGRGTKALLGVIRVVSRQPVVDAVKLALYRKDFYGAGDLTQEAMRGPSEWSVGDRELMAAYVAQAAASPFCVAAHTATSGEIGWRWAASGRLPRIVNAWRCAGGQDSRGSRPAAGYAARADRRGPP